MSLDAKYKRVPLADVTSPKNGIHMIYKDHFWIVGPDDEILKFGRGSWQCNSSREICEHLAPEGCTVRQVPLVFILVNPSDYVEG
jgi:hypothetical protein